MGLNKYADNSRVQQYLTSSQFYGSSTLGGFIGFHIKESTYFTNPKFRKYGILSLWVSIFYFIAIGVGVPIAVLATKTSFYSNY